MAPPVSATGTVVLVWSAALLLLVLSGIMFSQEQVLIKYLEFAQLEQVLSAEIDPT